MKSSKRLAVVLTDLVPQRVFLYKLDAITLEVKQQLRADVRLRLAETGLISSFVIPTNISKICDDIMYVKTEDIL